MTASLHDFFAGNAARLDMDRRWFADTGPLEVGAVRDVGEHLNVWENLGFIVDALDSQTATRRARLDATFACREADCEELQHIDCVSMITVERRQSDKQYVYDTLRSVFATFPPGVQVNLVVGDDQTAFVSMPKLRQELGATFAQQVHVHGASPEQAACLKAFPVARRACWNYARALRAYNGAKGMLLMEDDIQWAVGGVSRFDYWLAGHNLPVVSLYNYRGPPWPEDTQVKIADLVSTTFDEPRNVFDCTQTMYFSASMARALGDYILLRMHILPYDLLLDQFCAQFHLSIGHTRPSLVQHLGKNTNGLGFFHQSPCFSPSLVRRDTES